MGGRCGRFSAFAFGEEQQLGDTGVSVEDTVEDTGVSVEEQPW